MTQNEKPITIQLTMSQLNVVVGAIIKLPIEVGLETFTTIQQQTQAQLNATPEPQASASGPLSAKIVQ